MKSLAVGIIGVGSLGVKRASALAECRFGHLAAVADCDAARSAAVAAEYGVPALSISELLATPSIDAVLVCTPNASHADLSVAALQAGKHLLCEKPIGCQPTDAERIVAAVAETGRVFKMGSNHRYFRSVRAVRELIKSGSIGEILSMICRIGHNGERIQGSWYWAPEQAGGGALLDSGSHLVDLCRWFMGDFVACSGAAAQSFWKSAGVEDTASGILLTAAGRMAVLTTSRRLFSGYLHIEINGTNGFAWLDGRRDVFGVDRVTWSNSSNRNAPHVLDFSDDRSNSMALELDDFFDAIAAGRAISPSASDGLEVLRIITAIYAHPLTQLSSPGGTQPI
jgi:predicted dehydrogenase